MNGLRMMRWSVALSTIVIRSCFIRNMFYSRQCTGKVRIYLNWKMVKQNLSELSNFHEIKCDENRFCFSRISCSTQKTKKHRNKTLTKPAWANLWWTEEHNRLGVYLRAAPSRKSCATGLRFYMCNILQNIVLYINIKKHHILSLWKYGQALNSQNQAVILKERHTQKTINACGKHKNL